MLWSLETAAAPPCLDRAGSTPPGSTDDELRDAIGVESDAAADRLDPGAGAVVRRRVVRPRRRIGRAGCCWSVHHLAVDGVSWRILIDDLGEAFDQVRAGSRPDVARGADLDPVLRQDRQRECPAGSAIGGVRALDVDPGPGRRTRRPAPTRSV